MRNLIISALIAILIGTYAGAAFSGSGQETSLRSRIGTLERQVRVLKSNDAAMRQSIGTVAADVAYMGECEKNALPVTQFAWTSSGVTFLDITPQGQPVHYWLSTVESKCVESGQFKAMRR
jgi:hypothetical protein